MNGQWCEILWMGWAGWRVELSVFSLYIVSLVGSKGILDIESGPWISKTFLVFETDHWRLDQMRWGINLLISFSVSLTILIGSFWFQGIIKGHIKSISVLFLIKGKNLVTYPFFLCSTVIMILTLLAMPHFIYIPKYLWGPSWEMPYFCRCKFISEVFVKTGLLNVNCTTPKSCR